MTNLYEQPNLTTAGGSDELAPPPSAPPPSVAPPAWDPDADKPKPTGPVKGHLSGGEAPEPEVHRAPRFDCNPTAIFTTKWGARVGIIFVFILFCILPYVTILAGLNISSTGGAYAAVILLSLLGPVFLWALTIPCWMSDEDEGTMWSIVTMMFAFAMLMTMVICITITVLSAPNSMRKYKELKDGKFYPTPVSVGASDLRQSGARFFNFTDAMFFPGSVDEPIPVASYRFSCGKYVTKKVCDTPLVPTNYIFGQPIKVFAGCASLCGYAYSASCYDLYNSARTASPIHNCFREWRNKLSNQQFGAAQNSTFAYKHVSYYSMHRRAARYLGLPRDENAIYVRISRPEHVQAKQDRYYKYGFLSNMITFGIILGCAGVFLIGMIIVFAFGD